MSTIKNNKMLQKYNKNTNKHTKTYIKNKIKIIVAFLKTQYILKLNNNKRRTKWLRFQIVSFLFITAKQVSV